MLLNNGLVLKPTIIQPAQPTRLLEANERPDLEKAVRDSLIEAGHIVEVVEIPPIKEETISEIHELLDAIAEEPEDENSFEGANDVPPDENVIIDNPATTLIETSWSLTPDFYKDGVLTVKSVWDNKVHTFRASTEEEARALAFVELSTNYDTSNLSL